MDVAEEFAALVAKAASEKSSPAPPPTVPQTAPTAYVESFPMVTKVGPDFVDIYSIPDPEVMPPSAVLTPRDVLPVSKRKAVDRS
jgi:hypothetical protein